MRKPRVEDGKTRLLLEKTEFSLEFIEESRLFCSGSETVVLTSEELWGNASVSMGNWENIGKFIKI